MTKAGPRSSLFRAILIAAFVTLVISLVRLYGELQEWNPTVFGRAAGGGFALLGITWLVLPFGFWFGRRLAQNGSRPKSTARAILLPLGGMVLIVVGFIVGNVIWPDEPVGSRSADGWLSLGVLANGTAVIAGLATLIAYPRAWFVLMVYGFLARIPVIVIQYFALVNGWDVHFAKLPPGMPEDNALFALTLAQCLLWPLGFTPIIGGICAAIGAATVKAKS
ncbi:MAG: hypothetical protein NXI31_11955 [bacterium]|nr:hypothetical protein [bacterium]